MNPRVVSVKANDDYTLVLVFTNGETRIFDAANLLDTGVFKALKDITQFRQAAVAYGTVIWPGEIDLCPDTLYEDSKLLATLG
ncbi:DUF2442 domain-containing protein [bacterium]|nr:DUF2442 domain-containing protein [bacterium]